MEATPSFLDLQGLATLSGSVAAVVALTNGLHYAFSWTPRYVALLASLGVSALIASTSMADDWRVWALAFLNAFIIYTSAVGVATMGHAANARRRLSKTIDHGPEELSWRSSLLPRYW